MAQDDFGAAIGGMVRELGLPDRFFSEVFNEDDWSFVIKGHALLEAAATHVLVKITNDEGLRKVFARLEMSNKDTGKLAFMTSFNVLTKSERRFIIWFSQLRNLVVHNISHVNFSFSEYVASLPADKKKEFIKAV